MLIGGNGRCSNPCQWDICRTENFRGPRPLFCLGYVAGHLYGDSLLQGRNNASTKRMGDIRKLEKRASSSQLQGKVPLRRAPTGTPSIANPSTQVSHFLCPGGLYTNKNFGLSPR